MRQSTEIVGTIHLYGTSQVGFGWLAALCGENRRAGIMGDGEPNPNRNATSAVWLAADAIVAALGGNEGMVEIHRDSDIGPRVSVTPLSHLPHLYFGDLKWTAAPVYEISADALIAASEVPA